MEYYFEVEFECMPTDFYLVKAKDIVEAGNKAVEAFSDANSWCPDPAALLKRITRTKVFMVID